MNYEELLESRNGSTMSKEVMPFGLMYKKMVDGKYVNSIDLREDLKDSLVFCDAINTESEQNKKLVHKNQLHFVLATDSAGLYGVHVEQGSYRTFAKLLEDTPAVVAGKNFISNTIKDLLELTAYLHEQGIFHICYSPNNVFARKGDDAPMLLFHGSAYHAMNDQQALYGNDASFIAPEVIEEGTFDARADIYSLGKFIEFLYRHAEVPIELKSVIKKATNPDPEKRFQTPEEMQKCITNRQNTRKSVVSFLAAILIAAIAFGLYFTLVPDREDIEFVNPVTETVDLEDIEEGYDPTADLGQPMNTTVGKIDEKKMREYQAKAEQIFRKNFTREAEQILTKIYSNERMNTTEKKFLTSNKATLDELVQAQVKLGNEAGLSESRSQLIGGQIVEQITNKLKKEMMAKEEKKNKEEE